MVCTICNDEIETTTRNYTITECGHKFHTICLMKNVQTNGTVCPSCSVTTAGTRKTGKIIEPKYKAPYSRCTQMM